ncbi:hypothetical protein BDV29DRAFT_153971 [Aspergillus leporis]|uniref:Uncharacterized protein n=1 Tax=Aspergillus leporis TaxID=41062 RepID=A0A5N5X941_9EURO|nr:hypothetical protein BDV29DRAFT_153971 [Aspergillus leporis]
MSHRCSLNRILAKPGTLKQFLGLIGQASSPDIHPPTPYQTLTSTKSIPKTPTATATALSSPQTCGSPTQYEIPVQDASCAVPNKDKYPKLLDKCCHGAPVSAYDNDCAIYCLALGQSVQELTDCLYDAKVDWGDVWCFGNTSATATATSVSAKATATGTAAKKTDKESATGTKSGASATGTEKNGAASISVSKFVVGSLAVCSVVVLFV